MSTITKISEDIFEKEVIQSDKLTIVDFWADWCGPCKMITPVLEEIAAEYVDHVKIVKIDVDDDPHTAPNFDIKSIPTLLFYKDGQVVDRVIGALPKPYLVDKIKPYL